MTGRIEGMPTLETGRLVLRPFVLGDATEVRRLAGDFEIARMTLAVPHPYEEGMAEAWIGTHAPDFAAGRNATWAVTRREDSPLVGAITLTIQQTDGRAMLGYWVGREYWGNGYATEAGREVVRFGFDRLGLRRIYATHLGSNPASGRVMQKIGMTYEGRQVGHYFRWGNVEDCVLYGMLAHGRRE